MGYTDDEPSIDYFYRIGLEHSKLGHPHDAIFYFNQVLAVEPVHINALIHKGNSLGKLGKYQDAISSYDKVLELKPDNLVALLNKGLALHYLRKYKQSEDCYDKVLFHDHNNANALYHKACLKSLQKDSDSALLLLESAIKLDSEFSQKASDDSDFELLKQDARFKALVS